MSNNGRRTIPVETARMLLDYDQESGVFRWRQRPHHLFPSAGHNAEHNSKKWNAKFAGKVAGSHNRGGYLQISIFNKLYKGSRLAWAIMTGEWPRLEIDHINRNPSDDRWVNLRQATRSQNCTNQSIQKNNTSGLMCVSFCTEKRRYVARITRGRKLKHVGYFDCPAAAFLAVHVESDKIDGEFSPLTPVRAKKAQTEPQAQ